MSTLKMIKA